MFMGPDVNLLWSSSILPLPESILGPKWVAEASPWELTSLTWPHVNADSWLMQNCYLIPFWLVLTFEWRIWESVPKKLKLLRGGMFYPMKESRLLWIPPIVWRKLASSNFSPLCCKDAEPLGNTKPPEVRLTCWEIIALRESTMMHISTYDAFKFLICWSQEAIFMTAMFDNGDPSDLVKFLIELISTIWSWC